MVEDPLASTAAEHRLRLRERSTALVNRKSFIVNPHAPFILDPAA